MAKRVTTPLGVVSKNGPAHKSNIGLVIALTLLIVVLLLFVSMMLYDSIRNQAKTSPEQEAVNTTTPVPSVSEEGPKPVNLDLSGKGQSSSDQFELLAGGYLIKYNFKNNLENYGSFSDGTNFISKIKCDDGYTLHVSNAMAGEGAGSEYLKIGTKAKCFYLVESAAPSATWSVSINNS